MLLAFDLCGLVTGLRSVMFITDHWNGSASFDVKPVFRWHRWMTARGLVASSRRSTVKVTWHWTASVWWCRPHVADDPDWLPVGTCQHLAQHTSPPDLDILFHNDLARWLWNQMWTWQRSLPWSFDARALLTPVRCCFTLSPWHCRWPSSILWPWHSLCPWHLACASPWRSPWPQPGCWLTAFGTLSARWYLTNPVKPP